MNRLPDPSFQQKLDEFNDSRGGPAHIAVAFHPEKERWQIFVIPIMDSTHPLARNENTAKMIRPLPDGSGREGILLNTWEGKHGEFEPMDDRLFEAIDFADGFKDLHHFNRVVESPEMRREIANKAHLRAKVEATRRYYQRLDSLTIGAHSKSGDWRWRIR